MRLILTTKKTEEREDAVQHQYQEQEEHHRAEDSRRNDLEDERGIWIQVLQARLEQGFKLVDAIRDADQVLESYQERFQ